MICSSNVSVLHSFRDIATCAVYVTAVTLKIHSVLKKELKQRALADSCVNVEIDRVNA